MRTAITTLVLGLALSNTAHAGDLIWTDLGDEDFTMDWSPWTGDNSVVEVTHDDDSTRALLYVDDVLTAGWEVSFENGSTGFYGNEELYHYPSEYGVDPDAFEDAASNVIAAILAPQSLWNYSNLPDPSDFTNASLEVDVSGPVDGYCTVEATMVVQADWGPDDAVLNMIDMGWVVNEGTTFRDSWIPYYIAETETETSYQNILGGLHYFESTFEIPVDQEPIEVGGFYEWSELLFEDGFPFGTVASQDVVCQCELPADFDGDGTVGISDLLAVLTAFGSLDTTYDLDGDGAVAISDLLIVLTSYGKTYDC